MQLVSKHAFQTGSSEKVDYQTVSQAYVNIVTGCCMGLGLRYAGTADSEAKHCLVGILQGYVCMPLIVRYKSIQYGIPLWLLCIFD